MEAVVPVIIGEWCLSHNLKPGREYSALEKQLSYSLSVMPSLWHGNRQADISSGATSCFPNRRAGFQEVRGKRLAAGQSGKRLLIPGKACADDSRLRSFWVPAASFSRAFPPAGEMTR